ncbi:hypothetical protein JHK87_026963 [Glycine soja]|nr:hypothetical protein JHK87_026963 [Glycine soja]
MELDLRSAIMKQELMSIYKTSHAHVGCDNLQNETYENYIRPIRSQQYWETTTFDRLTPPHIKKRPGRPKKCRKKDQNEDQVNNNRLKRSYKEVTCTRCGLNGHNNRGCINSGVPPRPKKWKPTVDEGNNSNATTTTPVGNEQLKEDTITLCLGGFGDQRA